MTNLYQLLNRHPFDPFAPDILNALKAIQTVCPALSSFSVLPARHNPRHFRVEVGWFNRPMYRRTELKTMPRLLYVKPDGSIRFGTRPDHHGLSDRQKQWSKEINLFLVSNFS